VRDWVIRSKEEARQVLEHHCREQRYEGIRKKPQAWLTLSYPKTLAIAVYTFDEKGGPLVRAYEYTIECDLQEVGDVLGNPCWLRNISPRTERTRLKDEEQKQRELQGAGPRRPLPEKPLRQLHMFGCT
jgi:hypothetical protein